LAARLLDELLMSDEVLLLDGADDVSLLVVPLAPMLEVPVPLAPAELEVLGLVLLDVLGLVLLELLGLLYVLLDELGLVLLDVLGLVLLVVPPLVPELPDVCASAMPPAAKAAAAARVVRVFLVVIMSLLLECKPRRAIRLNEAGDSADSTEPTFAGGRQKVGLSRQSL
jgi:hypothetical protein